MSTRRLAESVEGLNSSLALAASDLWPKKGRPIAVNKGVKLVMFKTTDYTKQTSYWATSKFKKSPYDF